MSIPSTLPIANASFAASLDEMAPTRLNRVFGNELDNLIRRWRDLTGVPSSTHGCIFPAATICSDSATSSTDDTTAYYYKLFCSFNSSDLVYRDFDITISGSSTSATFSVGNGLAYDGLGRRVSINSSNNAIAYSASNPTAIDYFGQNKPKSTGCVGIVPAAGLSLSKKYWFFIQYQSAVATPSGTEYTSDSDSEYTVNKLTSDVSYTHWVDGYKILILSTDASSSYAPDYPADEAIYIGAIVPSSSSSGWSADYSNHVTSTGIAITRKFLTLPGELLAAELAASTDTEYAEGDSITFLKHLRALGSGGISKVSAANAHSLASVDLTDAANLNDELKAYTRALLDNCLIPAAKGGTQPLAYSTSGYTLNIANISTVSSVSETVFVNGKRFIYSTGGTIAAQSGSSPAIVKQSDGSFQIVIESTATTYYFYLEEADDVLTLCVATSEPSSARNILVLYSVIRTGDALTVTTYPGLTGDVGSLQLQDGAVTSGKLAASAVTTDKLGSGAVTTDKLGDASVSTSKVADSAITTAKILDSNITTAKIADGAVTTAKLSNNITVPTGAMLMWGNSTPPSGWIICDGSAKSRTVYADLFAIIGTAYGSGDGSSTFNLPNLTGRFPAGVGTGTDINSVSFNVPAGTANDTRGEYSHTNTQAETAIKEHRHYVVTTGAGGGGASVGVPYGSGAEVFPTSGVIGGGVDATSAHNNIPPFCGLWFIIKY